MERISRRSFTDSGNGMGQNRTHINLFYCAALQPDKWPRESSGRMNRVSEFFTTSVKLADLQNPDKTSVQNTGSWARVTPWLPWMLMAQAPGRGSRPAGACQAPCSPREG